MYRPLRPPTPSSVCRASRASLTLVAIAALGACTAADAAPDVRVWADAPRAQVTPDRLLSVEEGFQTVEDVTPDGQAIIVSGARMGRLGRVDLATGDTHWLTSAEAPYEPTWVLEAVAHPDGRKVAYHEYTGATNSWRPMVWRPDGPPLTPTDVDSYWNAPVAWSPDGHRLLTLAAGASSDRLLVYDVIAGTGPVSLISREDIESIGAHPGGDWIVYTRQIARDDEDRGVYLLSWDGTREVRLEGLPDGAEVVGWSPDGSTVLYETAGESPSLWRQEMRDTRAIGAPVLVQWDRWGMQSVGVDRNGAYIYAVDTSRRDVFTVALDADGRPVGDPARRAAGADGMRIGYSPDGESLLYLRNDGGEGAAGRRLVIESRATGATTTVELGVPISYISWGEWTADGTGLIVKVVDDLDRYAFYRYDLATAALDTVRVWNGPGVVGLHGTTPDGGGVVFSFRDEDSNAWRLEYLDLATGDERTVTALPGDEGRPGWMELSPDGSRLAFSTARSIRLVDLATGKVSRAVDAPVGWRTRPAWHPDGRHIYFTLDPFDNETGAPVRTTLHHADLETGNVIDLGIAADVFDVVAVHPEGLELSFAAVTRGPTEIWRIRDIFDAPVTTPSEMGADGGSSRR